MAGRKKDPIWNLYEEIKTDSGKSLRAKCKRCGKEMQGLVARMKSHEENCKVAEMEDGDSNPVPVSEVHAGGSNQNNKSQVEVRAVNLTQPTSVTDISKPPNAKKQKLDTFVIRTTSDDKRRFDLQLAKMIFATNSPFRLVENAEFKKFVQMLRPGYNPPSGR